MNPILHEYIKNHGCKGLQEIASALYDLTFNQELMDQLETEARKSEVDFNRWSIRCKAEELAFEISKQTP